jgi:acyl carrier protein
MAHRLYRVVSQVFGVPIEQITHVDSPDTLEAWDSLAHISLVLALEAEFEVSLTPDEAAEMLSVGAIRQILAAKGITGLEPSQAADKVV